MSTPVKIVLIFFTAVLTIAFTFMVAVCVTMKAEYWGKTMGNEAYGFFSFAMMITFLISIPTIILWVFLILKTRKNKSALVNS